MWPVGLLKPNRLGLFDIHGNAWEWCHDLYQSRSSDAVEMIVKDQESRVLRGGAFASQPEFVRSATRSLNLSASRTAYLGFRPARTYP
jgi:formylglycine-generating enzyme required for sulfatase activity